MRVFPLIYKAFVVISVMKTERIFRLLDAAEMLHRATVRRAELAERDTERLAIELELLTPETSMPIKSFTDLAPCKKRPFGSPETAVRAYSGSHPIKAYKCPRCQKWHITKKHYA